MQKLMGGPNHGNRPNNCCHKSTKSDCKFSFAHDSGPQRLVAPVSIAQLVRPQGGTTRAGQRTNRSALLATDQTTHGGAGTSTNRDRQLIAVLVPEAAFARLVIVVNASCRAGRTGISINDTRRRTSCARPAHRFLLLLTGSGKAIGEAGFVSSFLSGCVEARRG